MSAYAGQRIALLTQHGKEQVIGPALGDTLGCVVERITGFDTDQLGTFTREIPRAGTQLEAARKKARIGMELSGLPLGLASEGAFGPDPMLGAVPWNIELLLFIDDTLGIEVAAWAQQAARFDHALAGSWEEAADFARRAGFPEYHLAVRPQDQDDPRVEKGLHDWENLEAAFRRASGLTESRRVFIEHDLRAHAHPGRRETIRLAAQELARKLASTCPACAAPGFWLSEGVPGLPCADCGAPTRAWKAEIWRCARCGFHETRETATRQADPGRCDFCNP